jgi:hypothetical protein
MNLLRRLGINMYIEKYNDIVWDYIIAGLKDKSITVDNCVDKLNVKHNELVKIDNNVDNRNIKSFHWEFKNLKTKPVRTMRWINGEHALLYDWYECSECRTLVKTNDDVDDCLYVTLLCPNCNEIKSYPWYNVKTTTENLYSVLHQGALLKYYTASHDVFDHKKGYFCKPLIKIGKFKINWFSGYRTWKNNQPKDSKPNIFKYYTKYWELQNVERKAKFYIDFLEKDYGDKIEGLKRKESKKE